MTRFIVFVAIYLMAECAGIIVSALLWLYFAVGFSRDQDKWYSLQNGLQKRWAGTIFRAVSQLYRFSYSVEGDECLEESDAPFYLFMRHASIADTFIPSEFITAAHNITLRYVMKHELLWDPCLDIVGNRLPNYFVRRNTSPSKEIAAIQSLSKGLKEREGLLIYPEGTRFSRQKQKRIIEKMEQKDDDQLLKKAGKLEFTLPPKTGGPLGLLSTGEYADVVFLVHTGFELGARFADFYNGSLIDAEIKMYLWRVPSADIPAGQSARTDWLYDNWLIMDDWIKKNRQSAS